jgi:hypothetical protein
MVKVTSDQKTMTYRTFLINFGYNKYEGPCLTQAKAAAVSAGFESVIYLNEEPILSYNPIGGWRGFLSHQ